MPFSRKQIATISSIAARAFALHDKLDILNLPPDLEGDTKSNRLDWWRRGQLEAAAEKRSFKDCDARRDYLRVKNHFEKLAGQKPAAERTRQRAEFGSDSTHTDGCAALRKVRAAQKAAGLSDAYIAAVCADKFGGETDLRQLTEKQLWHLCFTIQARARNKTNSTTSHP